MCDCGKGCLTPDKATALQARVAELEGRCNVSHRQAACLQNRHQGNTHERLPAPRWKGRKMSDDLEAIVARLRSGSTYDDRTDAADLIEAQEAEITRLRAELATARCNDMGDAWIAQKHAWQEAIEGALLQWCDAPSEDESPKDALRRLIQHEITAALDPAVSQSAADLVATARRKGGEEAAKIADATVNANRVEYPKKWKDRPEGIPHDWSVSWETCAETAEEIAAAIRAAAGDGK